MALKILILVALFFIICFIAYPSDFKVGDMITLHVMELTKELGPNGEWIYGLKDYGIQREILIVDKNSCDIIITVNLEPNDIDSKKFIFYNGAYSLEIDETQLTAVLKFRRKKNG